MPLAWGSRVVVVVFLGVALGLLAPFGSIGPFIGLLLLLFLLFFVLLLSLFLPHPG